MPRAGGVVAALLLVLGVALQQCSAQHAPNSPQSYMEVRKAELYETQILSSWGSVPDFAAGHACRCWTRMHASSCR